MIENSLQPSLCPITQMRRWITSCFYLLCLICSLNFRNEGRDMNAQ